jgi:hypothetical protein
MLERTENSRRTKGPFSVNVRSFVVLNRSAGSANSFFFDDVRDGFDLSLENVMVIPVGNCSVGLCQDLASVLCSTVLYCARQPVPSACSQTHKGHLERPSWKGMHDLDGSESLTDAITGLTCMFVQVIIGDVERVEVRRDFRLFRPFIQRHWLDLYSIFLLCPYQDRIHLCRVPDDILEPVPSFEYSIPGTQRIVILIFLFGVPGRISPAQCRTRLRTKNT